jgi:putative spermidine/putrescine transport system permease protein
MSDSTNTGPMLAADGTPLKRSLRRALRAQKMRALALIAPLLLFVLLTFIAPIIDMLFRSVENQIVGNTLPMTVEELRDWDSGDAPDEQVFRALFFDLFLAAEAKEHTKLGSRLNYEKSGISSLFRTSGRDMSDIGEVFQDALLEVDPAFDEATTWVEMMSGGAGAEPNERLMSNQIARLEALEASEFSGDAEFQPGAAISDILPNTARAYSAFAAFTQFVDGKSVTKEEPWEAVYAALALDLEDPATKTAIETYAGPGGDLLRAAAAAQLPPVAMREAFFESNKDWANVTFWETIKTYSPPYTTGYFLNAVDMEKTPQGIALRSEDERIYGILFQRTMFMSLMITLSCVALGYPVAWILANLPSRTANLLMILVLLPFWTSLLVRTSAWKVMLQQQGVINDVLVWLGLVADENRLVMINNQFGTIVAMTHILLPFMILPMYSVMQTIPPTYLRAAKSLGANNWTAFWRVYFPQSVPGIGAGSILVFILAIGYYITPEIVGGTTGTFISNRIAYHISSSLNWGLAAALGTILLAVVLILYWAYDKIVGIDNVKLG